MFEDRSVMCATSAPGWQLPYTGRQDSSRSGQIHKDWLGLGIIDPSQDSYWRKRLFESGPGQVFAISVDDINGSRKAALAAVCRYKLHFSVQKVESAAAEAWLSEGGFVIFKILATDFPAARAYSGNNPATV